MSGKRMWGGLLLGWWPLVVVTALGGCGKSSSSTSSGSTTPTTGGGGSEGGTPGTTSTTGSGFTNDGSLPIPGQIISGAQCLTVSEIKGIARPTEKFAVRVYTQWPYSTTWNRMDTGTCATDTPSTTAVTCNVDIPEAELHFSRTYIEIFAEDGSSQCDVIYFTPYSYLATTAIEAWVGWEEAKVGCEDYQTAPKCWNGAGKQLVQGFPRHRSIVFNLKDRSYTNWCAGTMVDSAHVAQKGFFTNRWMSNDLVVRTADIAIANDGYVGTIAGARMTDWTFNCVNKYDDSQYSIQMTINDVNTDGTGPNTIPSWQ